MKKVQEIGTVNVSYDEIGKPVQAIFTASPYTVTDPEVLSQLLTVKNDSQEEIQKNAELVISSWFSNLDEIQMLDREKFTITSEVVSCGKFGDGKIATCKITFYLNQF